MTDITITLPTAANPFEAPAREARRTPGRIRNYWAGLGAAIAAYGQAMGQAHAAPFRAPAKGLRPELDGQAEGRDPNW